MKDNFSTQSDQYLKYRPSYPKEFFDFLITLIPIREKAWDCGTGNGQIATELSNYFDLVVATDISQLQLENAVKDDKVIYSLQPAEKTNFPDNYFDLIIVGQAIHWFEFDQFYTEVNRTLKKNGLITVIGYNRPQVTTEINRIITSFYKNVLGLYWDEERKYIDDNYQTIPFPFEELNTPSFENIKEWSFEHLIGYLRTWSAVKHYIKENGEDPINIIYEELKKAWGNEHLRQIKLPLLLRIGKNPAF